MNTGYRDLFSNVKNNTEFSADTKVGIYEHMIDRLLDAVDELNKQRCVELVRDTKTNCDAQCKEYEKKLIELERNKDSEIRKLKSELIGIKYDKETIEKKLQLLNAEEKLDKLVENMDDILSFLRLHVIDESIW